MYEKNDNLWTVTLQLLNTSVEFHNDTETEVMIVVSETVHQIVGSLSLTQLDQTLRGPMVTVYYD